MAFQLDLSPLPAVTRWETAVRYYEARLGQDMLGDWVLELAWGGRRNRLGGRKQRVVDGAAQGSKALQQLDARRLRRGYVLVAVVRDIPYQS